MTDVWDPAPLDLALLSSWTGRQERREDLMNAAPLANLAATLDHDEPDPQPGDPAPPLSHWLYFLPRERQSLLGPDGHAQRGGFLPPVPLPRRMWAGGRLTFHQPLRVSETMIRVSTIQKIDHKAGRSGSLVFVKVRHEIFAGPEERLVLNEEQDIVYRSAPTPGHPAPQPRPAPTEMLWRRRIHPDSPLLFRYSALTFNGHRIHYDRPYATQTEGYPGLIVQGPLIATLLVDLLRRERPAERLTAFEFRAVRPLFDIADFEIAGLPSIAGTTVQLWAVDAEGWLAMEAKATLG